MKKWKYMLLATLALAGFAPLGAHTIILRNGQVFYGEVVQQDRQNIYVAMKGGKKTYPKSTVLKILFQEVKEEDSLKKIIRAEIAKQAPANVEEDIKIVDFNDYIKELQISEKYASMRSGMIWRSAILPGWGQWHADQNIRGSIYAGLYVVAVGASAKFYLENKKARSDYYEMTVPALMYVTVPGTPGMLMRAMHYQPIRDRVDASHQHARTAELSAAFIWGAAMVNSLFFAPAPPATAPTAAAPRFEWQLSALPVSRNQPGGGGMDHLVGLNLTMAF